MKLDKQQLHELSDYIDWLWDATEFDVDSYEDVKKAISKELDKLRDNENTINHFDSY